MLTMLSLIPARLLIEREKPDRAAVFEALNDKLDVNEMEELEEIWGGAEAAVQPSEAASGKCAQCGSTNVVTDGVEASYVCEDCGVTWFCADYTTYGRKVTEALTRPSGEATYTVRTSSRGTYHATDNFERYLFSRMPGSGFYISRSDREAITSFIRREGLPSFSAYRLELARLNMRKYWQRYKQMLAMTYPERSHEWLTRIPAQLIRRISRYHRLLCGIFYERYAKEHGLKCFPHRGLVAMFLLWKHRDTVPIMRFMDPPRLRETASRRLRELGEMEALLAADSWRERVVQGPAFPLDLIYPAEHRGNARPMTEVTEEMLLTRWDFLQPPV